MDNGSVNEDADLTEHRYTITTVKRRRFTTPLEFNELWWINNIGHFWYEALKQILTDPRLLNCLDKVEENLANKIAIYPPKNLIFNAFIHTPLPSVKVVIVGQDPYHKPGQAMGLSFSVPRSVIKPPSLKNIIKELNAEFDCDGINFDHGDLTEWTKQGVFLINDSLTVECNKAASHKNYGWSVLTDEAIKQISSSGRNVVFMLWGEFAKKKKRIIASDKHLILEAGHPSPLSARYFLGCRHFTLANKYFEEKEILPIDWLAPWRKIIQEKT